MRFRYAVDFAVQSDVRFCSHRDMIRLFARALARAELPVRFSEGFNPHPKFSLSLPRPVGVATEGDRLVVELTREIEEGELAGRLSETLPEGMTVLGARRLTDAERCHPRRVWYVVALPHLERETVGPRLAGLIGSGPLWVQRLDKRNGRPKRVDIAPFLDALTLADEGLAMTLRVTEEGTAKPAEVCAVLGITDDAVTSRTRRVRIEWD